jgi:hypothetical protein
MTVIYRIISFLINVFAIFIAVALLFILPVALVNFAMLFPAFLLIGVVLYSWFSTRFRQQVLVKNEMAKTSLRDWVRVNGFVTIAFSILYTISTIALLRNPDEVIKSSKEIMTKMDPRFGDNFRPEVINAVGIIILAYCTMLLIHVLWTFILLRKHKDFFEQPQ